MSDKVLAELSGMYRILLATGHELIGQLQQRGGVWLEVDTSDGAVLLSQVQIVAIAPVDFVWQVAAQGKATKAAKTHQPKTAGKPSASMEVDFWTEQRLKQLSEAFLDGLTDQYLADKFKQSKTSVRDLRHAFEAARGTIDDLDLSPSTRVWVQRWQGVLTA